jgi:hypothetical protein
LALFFAEAADSPELDAEGADAARLYCIDKEELDCYCELEELLFLRMLLGWKSS